MIHNRKRVDYPPPEIEVPPEYDTLENIHGEEVELNQENFAKLCKKVTEIQQNRGETIDKIENKLDNLEKTVENLRIDIQNLETSDHLVRDMKEDLQKTARIISTLRVEAADLEQFQQHTT